MKDRTWIQQGKADKRSMANRLPFSKWLLQYQGEATAVGDLARQVARDPEWADPPSLAALESQLSGAGCARAVLETARRAWRRYASDAGGLSPAK
jgi:hypothetical protein